MPNLEEAFETACKERIIPGAVLAATNHDGSESYLRAFGVKSLENEAQQEPLTTDAIMLMASCTKLMTSVAALQVVERGLIGLDDDVAGHLPELAEQPILTGFDHDGKPVLKDRKNKITLRHLLTHSSGCGYESMSARLETYLAAINRRPGTGDSCPTKFNLPLLFEPGTAWSYGSSLDWAGYLVEKLTNSTLETYMQKNIWDPLGIRDITFWPDERSDMHARRTGLTLRDQEDVKNGKVVHYGGPTINRGVKTCLGGQGAYGSMPSYLKILHSLLLNDSKLLKPETVESMFSPQLTEASKQSLEQIRQKPEIWNLFVGRLPDHVGLDWGLAGILTTEKDEGWRREGTLMWSGLPNLFWWIDRKSGICGIFGTQVIPPGDPQTEDMIVLFEKAMYERLLATDSKL